MQARKDDSGLWIVVLDRGEPLRSTLEEWAKKEGVQGAAVQGIGALMDVELGFYHLDRGEYHRAVYKGDYELISCDGNISMKDGEPFLHVHVSLGASDFHVIGGHCFDATVAVTMECMIQPLAKPIERHYCAEVKLPTIRP